MVILITTYNREELLKDLLSDFQGSNAKFIILDDGSDKEYNLSEVDLDISYFHFIENRGKQRYHELISFGFERLKKERFSYAFQLPDDVRVKPDFIKESLRLWETIQDERKLCLSVGHTHGRHFRPCWTNFYPQKISSEIIHTQWNDLCYLAPRSFFEALKWNIEKPDISRWRDTPELGSGVGGYISRTLFNAGWNMYHALDSLVEFLPVESKMNVQLVK